jgi:hypothetical protein
MCNRTPLALVAVACLAVIGLGCSGRQSGSGVGPPQIDPRLPRVATPASADQACSMDTECVLAQDCCGCAGGGRLLAVRGDRVDALRAAADRGCSQRCAASGPTQHRSCTASEAVCRGGRCIPSLGSASP